MKTSGEYMRFASAAATVSLLLSGCIYFEIDTTLEPDGGGVRTLEVVAKQTGDSEIEVTADEFTRLMNLGAERGWSHGVEERDGEDVHVFRRESRVRGPGAWSRIGSDVDIVGALPATARDSVGYVTFGDVRFRNSIHVEVRDGPDGRTLVYRERFEWTELLDALVERHLEAFGEQLRSRYPDLGARRSGELIGMYRAGLWSAIDRGVLDAKGAEGERLVAEVSERLAYLATQVARQRYPNAEREFFAEAARYALDEGNEEIAETIESKLLGAQLAGNTQITVRLNMPGRVTDSNAHEREDSTLEWEFSPWDAAAAPLELFAEAVMKQ